MLNVLASMLPYFMSSQTDVCYRPTHVAVVSAWWSCATTYAQHLHNTYKHMQPHTTDAQAPNTGI